MEGEKLKIKIKEFGKTIDVFKVDDFDEFEPTFKELKKKYGKGREK